MDRSELLRLLLKTVGFWSFIGGISALPQAIRYSHGFEDEMELLILVAERFAGCGLLIIVGWLLIRHTQWFVAMAYRGTAALAADSSNRSTPESFVAVLQALGYWEILNGIIRLPFDFATLAMASERHFEGVAYSGIVILAGCLLVFMTDWCVEFAYSQPVAASEVCPATGVTRVSGSSMDPCQPRMR